MGQSTDAILFYGYVWDEEVSLFEESDDDEIGEYESDETEWQDKVLLARGVPPINWDNYPERRYGDGKPPVTEKEREEWETASGCKVWDAAKDQLEAEFPVSIATHCSCDYPMPYIYIKGTEVTAYRGTPSAIPPVSMNIDPAWNSQLAGFVEAVGVDLSEAEGPGWFMVSMWC